MYELKPCPFCGGEAEVDGGGCYWIHCKHCKVETRTHHSRIGAINLWNNRVEDKERVIDDGK